ncbi:hypothetical protein GSC47_001360 [Salmonella enterica]|nr:hypothetical protein [Salmonella enterica]
MAVKFEVIIKEKDDGSDIHATCTLFHSWKGTTQRETDLGKWLDDTVNALCRTKFRENNILINKE